MPALQTRELWEQSGRWARYQEEGILYQLKDSRGRELCLGPTHEEVVTELARIQIRSYKQLPQLVYQVQTKFRDERRSRSGLLRAREFIMKDAYSFDRDLSGLQQIYARMREAYQRIFSRCGARFIIQGADSGAMGGSVSEEFMALADCGEDVIQQEERRAIEIGHIFQLGTRYAEPMRACFADETQTERPLWMGCYGIGVSRLAQVIVEQRCDERGICWPAQIAPYGVHLLQTKPGDQEQTALALRLEAELGKRGVEVF